MGGYTLVGGLAMLHSNEYITREQSVPQLADAIVKALQKQGPRRSGPSTLTINLTSPIDGRVLDQKIIDLMDLEDMRTLKSSARARRETPRP